MTPPEPAPEPAEAPGSDPSSGVDGTAETAEAVPAVVVVMVAHDPGPWWEDALASLAGQTYPSIAVLVVDTASTEPLDDRLAAVLPAAHLHRTEDNIGFGPAVNDAVAAVEGAAFYLLCHDDVRLDAGVVQALVEEAFRSNAGIVGPKLVAWDDPERLLQVGMGADKFGEPAPLVERGELDQEQHDAVRDVFYVPGAVTLVRADLFEAVGGFDPEIDLLGEDLDLAWRAHAVGARVLVAPAARVAHREALAERLPPEEHRRLRLRHRLRAVEADYGRWHRIRVIPQAFVLALVEAVYVLVLGRVRHARDVLGAGPWNLARRAGVKARRRQLAAVRHVRDRDVRRLQVRGSARLSAFFRGQLGANDDRIGTMVGAGRGIARTLRSPTARSSLLAWLAVLGLLAIGSRSLLTSPIPAVGQFAAFPSEPLDVLRAWLSGYDATGLGAERANPTGFGLIGTAGIAFLGAMGQLRRVLILALLPLGVLGMWRLARPIGSRRSRIVAIVAYAALPVGVNALAQARWDGLVAYALAPWVFNQLARASRLAPFGETGDAAGPGAVDRPLVHRVLVLGGLTALGVVATPAFAVVPVGVAVAFVVGGLVVGQVRGGLRMLVTALGAVVVAFVLHLPWSLTFLTADWRQAVGLATVTRPDLSTVEVLAFATGPAVPSLVTLGLVVAGTLALVVGRRWRLAWAVRGWTVAAAGWAAVWVAARGDATGWLPHAEVLLAPAAAGLALAVALGMAAFEVDLPGYSIGWRQLASVGALAALVLGVLPTLAATSGGSWELPSGDAGQMLSRLPSATDAFRMLWIGDSDVLPVQGYPVSVPALRGSDPFQTVTYATTSSRSPSVLDSWPGSPQPATWRIDDALRTAAEGGTDRLGALLAPMGIEYVIVPDRLAPMPYVEEPHARPEAVLQLLADQLDLARVEMPDGLVVYRNAAFGPTRARLDAGTPLPSGGPALTDRVVPELAGAPTALADATGPTAFSGELPAPSLVYQAAVGDNWRLESGGTTPPRVPALGWAGSWAVEQGGAATLTYATPPARYGAAAGEVLAWILLLVLLVRQRARKAEVVAP